MTKELVITSEYADLRVVAVVEDARRILRGISRGNVALARVSPLLLYFRGQVRQVPDRREAGNSQRTFLIQANWQRNFTHFRLLCVEQFL